MKKLILSLCVLGTTVMAANAQTKIGYININELVAVMPEAVKADKDLQDLQEMLQLKKAELTNKVVELDSLLTKTDTLPPKMTKAKLSLLKDDFKKYYIEFNQFDQKAQEELQQKQQELVGPIQNKAAETARAVAKENGYTYVFIKDALLVAPPADDILGLCKKKLNIVDKPASKPVAPGGK